MDGAFLFTRTSRASRKAEWSCAKAVTFIVTLAATRNVTLAARAAGMSRKAAYALKGRDPAFAAAWHAALARRKGDKGDEVDDPRISLSQGNKGRRAVASNESIGLSPADSYRAAIRAEDERRRERFFAGLAQTCSAPRPGLD